MTTQAVPAGVTPDEFVAQHAGREFTNHAGARGRLVGVVENMGVAGNRAERAMLLFAAVGQNGSPFCYPWRDFIDELRPYAGLVITGSGRPIRWYGPSDGEAAELATGILALPSSRQEGRE